MKRLIPLLLATLLLFGCACPPESPAVTTVPSTETAPPAESAEVTPSLDDTAVPSEVTEPTLPPDPLDALMARLTLRQKVGQLFIAAPEQLLSGEAVTSVSAGLASKLAEYPLGGIILFSQNIRDPEQLLALNQALTKTCSLSPFLAVDEEGGTVARLAGHDAFDLPVYESAGAVGASGDPADAYAMGQAIGSYLHEYGFNLDFAPVADVNTNPDNPVIGDRAFSSDPRTAARMAAAFAAGLGEYGVCATYKHFPGHGDTAEDSHLGLAVSRHSQEVLENREWIPFREATAADLVMIAHVALPEITGNMTPATLSQTIVSGILREELGFEGLIITDAMNMGAIADTYGSGEAALAAFAAGCDMVLMPENLEEAFSAVLAALEDGTLTLDWLNATVRRILSFKQAKGILILP